ncbi:hypothetical protein U14_02048 [Candidatus Moduliflexus flocculans]|uniref:Porin n=1 Tax=Candidatus Moduliflexus flocculans TaxID=1499966 RepID=A0A0S6VTP3_9BACT|nr:hypothetical protein U14_02048 [Candidatus Moduliflexus flocculans]
MKLRALFATACAGLLVAPMAFAEVSAKVGLSGDVETNTTWQYFTTEKGAGSDDLNSNAWSNDGRTHLKLTGRVDSDSGWFAAAQGDAMIATGGTTGVDDAWVQFGTSSFATKIGRYGLEELLSKGQDTYIAEAPLRGAGRYQGDYFRGRFGDAIGNIGFDFTFSETSKMQIGVIVGGKDVSSVLLSTDSTGTAVQSTATFGANVYGIRPVFIFNSGAFTVKVGGEYGMTSAKDEKISSGTTWVDNDYEKNQMGGAVDLSMTAGTMSFGVAGAYGQTTGQWVTGEDVADLTQMSVFGWFKMPVGEADTLGLGVGYFSNDTKDVVTNDSVESYISYAHQLPVEGLKMTFAGSYAMASADPEKGSSQDSSAYGVRMRMNYDF